MDKKDLKNLKDIQKDLKKYALDIRSMKELTELDWQADRLEVIVKRIKLITGHGTGDS